MKKLYFVLSFLCLALSMQAQTQLTTDQLRELYTTTDGSWVSIHDPSVVYHDGEYYIWGSHLGAASSSDLITFKSVSVGNNTFRQLSKQGDSSGSACSYSTAFNTQQVTQVTNYLGNTVSMPNFDAEAYCARYAADKETWIDGDMWAPDIIWNKDMQKWCMYLSLNGDNWSSIIILLTSDSPTEGFTYQAPIVMSGFNGQTYSGVAAPAVSETDLEIATGETSLPSRYNQDEYGTYWPNCIDPCVFYDEEGQLWMSYGSWSGGIFMLRLDNTTGLRDYTYTYTSDYDSKGADGTSDPYFGKKIAGGYYVSGEGSYIQHIGSYYYLFMSYGFYSPDGGYEMRLFRSENPDGPYEDASGNVATYSNYWVLNYGPGAATNRGMLLMEAYNDWGGLQNLGERAQGHNSACQDDMGRSFVVYHTKFNDGTDGHQVRVHQLYTNQNGWLVASPFIYQGETLTDDDISSTQTWSTSDLTGDYQVILHKYQMDHSNYAETTPVIIHLSEDGSVSGDMTGSWELKDNTGYIQIKLSSVTYYGILCDQSINGTTTGQDLKETTLKAIAFSATAESGAPVWGYKLEPNYAVAWNYGQGNITITDGQTVDSNIHMMFDTDNNTTLTWTSSSPDIISLTGKYSPIANDTEVSLSARLDCDDYYWAETYNVTALADYTPEGDYLSGLVAYYNFDENPTYNQYKDPSATDYDQVTYGHYGTGTTPTLLEDYDRFGQVAHVYFGANGYNSYGQMPNPLYEQSDLEGFTVSAWINRTDTNGWDALWGFCGYNSYSGSGPRFYMTGNTYVGYNDDAGTWFDFNYPDVLYSDIPVDNWTLVTLTIGPSNKVCVYINGEAQSMHALNTSAGATSVSELPISELVDDITGLAYFNIGNGSWWGSPDYYVDDLMVYNRELSAEDVYALNVMANRVTDFTVGENGTGAGIEEILSPETLTKGRYADGIYTIQGVRVNDMTQKGIYIVNGRKVLVK